VADNEVTISLEVLDNATKNLDKISKSVENLEKQFNKSSEKAASSFETFQGVLGAELAIKGIEALGEAATELFNIFITDGIKAAQAEESALNALGFALASAGKLTEGAVQGFEEFSQALEKNSKFSGAAITNAAALVESLGNLDQSGLKRATQATVDLASALRIDLDTAARLVGKAAEGNVESFKKFGLQIKKSEDNASTFANALSAIEKRFGGAGLNAINTYEGALTQAKNSFEELIKVTGNAIIKNQVVIGVIKGVADVFNELTDNAKPLQQVFAEGIANAILTTVDAFTLLFGLLQPIEQLFRATFGSIGQAVAATAAAVASAANGDFKGALEIIKSGVEDTGKAFTEGLNADGLSGTLGSAFAKIRTSAGAAFDDLKKGLVETGSELTNNTEVLTQYTEAQLKAAEAGTSLAQSLTTVQAQLAVETEALNIALAERAISIQDFEDARLGILAATQEQELQQLNAALEQKRISEETYASAVIALNRKTAVEAQKIEADRNQKELALRELRLQQAATFFGNLTSLSKTGNKDLFEISKAAGYAEASINGYIAITRALREGGPFLGPLLAASIAIKTGVELANISATKLAGGIDSVPGVGTRDNFPAILAPGERVIPAKSNQDLTKFLSGSGDTNVLLSELISVIGSQNPQTIVNIGNKEIVNTINDSINSGRSIAV
jgi:hypothetical protein